MPITLTCPSCGKNLRVADHLAGKRGKCPGCGEPVTIPAPPSEPVGGYELADPDEPVQRAVPASAGTTGGAAASPLAEPTPVKPASIPTPERCTNCGKAMRPGDHHCATCGYMPRTGGFAQLDGQRFRDPDAVRMERQYRVTRRIRLAGLAALVALTIAGVAWYVLGPGRNVHVVRVQPVYATRALAGLEIREPYSLYTGEGDRSLGVKLPQSKSTPIAGAATVDQVHSFGGGDGLQVLQPDARGDHLLVVLNVRQSLLDDLDMRQKYDVSLQQSRIEVVDEQGRAYPVTLLQQPLTDSVELDLAGGSGSPMNLFPPDIEPSTRLTRPGEGGDDATGTLRYDRPDAQGQIEFTSMARLTGMPGVTGLSATGKLVTEHPGRLQVTYDYRGGDGTVSWSRGAEGWWASRGYYDDRSMSPWTRHRVALLVPRPADAEKLTVRFAGEPVATVSTGQMTLASAEPRDTPAAPAPTPTTPPPAKKSPTNNPLAYFDILVEARNRARGIVNMSNMQQLGLGLRMHLDQHGRWPDELRELEPLLGSVDRLLLNEQTGAMPGYLYEKPAPNADPATTVVLWPIDSNGQKDPGAPVLYADGRVGPPPQP